MSTRSERAKRVPKCRRCGEVRAAHFVPPSFGDPGFYICDPNNELGPTTTPRRRTT